MQQAKASPGSYPVVEPVRLSHLKIKQTEKLVAIRASLVASGHASLSAQAQALGLSRSTAWHILNGRHKSSGLSASIIARIVSSPKLPTETRGYGSVPPHWKSSLMDVSISVTDEEVTRWRHLLAKQEGFHVGYSAAANVCAATLLLASGRLPADAIVVTVLCDTGLKY
jgi:cysteine synthase